MENCTEPRAKVFGWMDDTIPSRSRNGAGDNMRPFGPLPQYVEYNIDHFNLNPEMA